MWSRRDSDRENKTLSITWNATYFNIDELLYSSLINLANKSNKIPKSRDVKRASQANFNNLQLQCPTPKASSDPLGLM